MSIEQEIRDAIERNKAIREKVGQTNCTLSKLENKCEQYMKDSDEAYQRGLNDAWDVARKIAVETDDGGVSISDLYKIFGTESMCMIMKNNTVYDAIAKLKAYEDKQKDDDHIKVGDCVYDKEEQPRDDGVVTWVGKDTAYVMWRDGSSGERMKESLCKTGRTLNVEAILEAMRT